MTWIVAVIFCMFECCYSGQVSLVIYGSRFWFQTCSSLIVCHAYACMESKVFVLCVWVFFYKLGHVVCWSDKLLYQLCMICNCSPLHRHTYVCVLRLPFYISKIFYLALCTILTNLIFISCHFMLDANVQTITVLCPMLYIVHPSTCVQCQCLALFALLAAG